jgi:acetolactate synthase-1/2/3 large subunit
LLTGRVDVLLVIGTSLGELQTHAWHPGLQPTSALIHVDLDPTEIGKNYPADVGIVGDARATLREINENINRLFKGTAQHDPLERIRAEVARYTKGELLQSDSLPLKPQRVIAEMQRELPEDTLLFVDTGNCVTWAGHYYEVRKPATYFQAMGFAVIWIVLNNGGHGMVYQGDRILLNRRFDSSGFRRPLDVCGIARSIGAKAFRADSPETLRTALREAPTRRA